MQERASPTATSTPSSPAPQPAAPALSEFAATPTRVVVHDPVATGAFEVLDGGSGEERGGRTLVRGG